MPVVGHAIGHGADVTILAAAAAAK